MSAPPSGQRLTSWLPFAAAIGVPLVILAVTAVFSFAQSTREAERRAERTVHALSEHALRTFRAHDLVIRAVDAYIKGWDWARINASQDLHEFFKGLIRDANDINTVFVVGPNGRDGNSSLLFPLAPTDMTGRPFYQEMLGRSGLHISAPDVGRVNQQRYFSFTRRRSTADNSFDGIISISVNPAYFDAFYKTVTESATDSVSLVRSDGLLLVRIPGDPPVGDRMLPRTPGGLMAMLDTRPERGVFSQVGSVDGIERIYAYRRVGDYPLYATYGLSYATVWAEWRRNMLGYALVCLAATVLLVAAALLVRRHDRREAEAAARYLEESIRRRSAEEANRSKDEFLATLGHELRNPLSSISASAELLRRAGPGDAKAGGAVDIIGRQVDHLRRLLNDLLDVARGIYGKMTIDPQVVSLHDIAASIATTSAGALNGEVAITCRGARGWVRADPMRLRQVIENLVDNAKKYGARNIAMEVRESGDQADLTVTDDGDGIPADLLPTIFEPFVQGKQALDRAMGGLGLGLALCQRIAVAHGGALQAASEGIGKGSVFTLSLPASPPPAEVPPAQAPAAVPHARGRILVIEDQEDARDSLRLLLELDGHTVSTAASGPEGLARLEALEPAVVIIDIGLPGMDGFDVARAIRSRPSGSTMRLIALTGYGQPDDQRNAHDAGFDHHLTKPVDYDALTRLLARAETTGR